jgi:hypothetical protein
VFPQNLLSKTPLLDTPFVQRVLFPESYLIIKTGAVASPKKIATEVVLLLAPVCYRGGLKMADVKEEKIMKGIDYVWSFHVLLSLPVNDMGENLRR